MLETHVRPDVTRERPGAGRLSFALLGAAAAAGASAVATQAIMIAVNAPDFSFWGFAIYTSVYFAVITGVVGLVVDAVIWVAGVRLLPSTGRAIAVAGLHLVIVLALLRVGEAMLGPALFDVAFWLAVVTPAVVGATVIGLLVWRHRPEGSWAAARKRARTAGPPPGSGGWDGRDGLHLDQDAGA